MAYRLKASDGSVATALSRIAVERLAKAEMRLSGAGLTGARGHRLHAAVWEARKEVKKVRGLLRLVRGAMPDYAEWNGALRDAARTVSPFRDLWARVEACDAAIALCPDAPALVRLREEMADRADRAARRAESVDRARDFRDALAVIRDAAEDWTLDRDGWAALAPGVTRALARGRADMRRAVRTGDETLRHDWRKRVKYHWYHARLLSPAWPEGMAPRLALADRTATLLGDHRNLGEFIADPLVAGTLSFSRARLGERIEAERARLLDEAGAAARLLFAEAPEAVAAQWGAWYALSDLPGSAAHRERGARAGRSGRTKEASV